VLFAFVVFVFEEMAGFFVPAQIIPSWWIWLYYLSWFRYVFEAMVNSFHKLITFWILIVLLI
jgi:ABC-type multidrug transport system permease subunit